MQRDEQSPEGLAPIVVTHAGVAHDELTDPVARSFVESLQRETEASLAALLPQIVAEGGQVRVEVPPDYGDADVFVYGMSAALMSAVLAAL